MHRATTTCTFSTSQFPKVIRFWSVLYILTSKCISRYNGIHFFDILNSKNGPGMVYFVYFNFEIYFAIQFFISPLANWLRTRRFSDPTFRPSETTNHQKNTVFRDFPTFFVHLYLLFSYSFFSTLLFSNFSLLSASSLLFFSSFILSEICLLNFLQ